MRLMDTLTKEELINLVNNNDNYTACLKEIGYTAISGDTLTAFKNKLTDLSIDTSHFIQFGTIKNVKSRTDEEIFIKDSIVSQNCVRNHYKTKYPPISCTICGQSNTWNNQVLTMILDHINGDNHDNRLENLRWVCPNCNSQLPTTSARNPHRKILTVCRDCGKPISKGAIRCEDCAKLWRHNDDNPNKVTNRPGRAELKQLIRTTSFAAIGRQYGVDGNSVKKWCDWEHLPRLKRDIKNYSDDEWKLI